MGFPGFLTPVSRCQLSSLWPHLDHGLGRCGPGYQDRTLHRRTMCPLQGNWSYQSTLSNKKLDHSINEHRIKRIKLCPLLKKSMNMQRNIPFYLLVHALFACTNFCTRGTWHLELVTGQLGNPLLVTNEFVIFGMHLAHLDMRVCSWGTTGVPPGARSLIIFYLQLTSEFTREKQ